MVGFVISNSATPPFVIAVLVWFAITSRSFATELTPSSVWGSVPVVVVISCPRYPSMPATPDQLSLAVISPVFDQSWLNGKVWGVVLASAKLPPAKLVSMNTKAASARSQRQCTADDWSDIPFSLLLTLH